MEQKIRLQQNVLSFSQAEQHTGGNMTTPPQFTEAQTKKHERAQHVSSPGHPIRSTGSELSSSRSDHGPEPSMLSPETREVKSHLDLSSNHLDHHHRNEPLSFLNEGGIDRTQALVSALNNLLSEQTDTSTVASFSSAENNKQLPSTQPTQSAEEHIKLPEFTDSEGYASILTESVRPSRHGGPAATRPSVQQIQVPLYLTAPNRQTGIVNSAPLLFSSSTNPQNPHNPHNPHNSPNPHNHRSSGGSLSPTLTKPVNKVDPIPNSESAVKMPGATAVSPFLAPSDTRSASEISKGWSHGFSFNEVERISLERDSLLAQLEVQIKVNTDLKKLLVASVGEDLENRVEYLARDRAQLVVEVGDYSKRLHKDFEDLDRLSIQADMWRSKCMASRVMIDELSGMKSQMAMKFHECQHALQEMLQERHEVRTNLQEIQSCLADLRDAFDPKHAQKYPDQEMGNVIDLARTSKQLADVVHFRLLGSRPGLKTLNVDLDLDDNLTAAEYHASQILSDEGIVQEKIRKEIPFHQYMERYDRFHPLTQYERLTINCCGKCNGEIKLV